MNPSNTVSGVVADKHLEKPVPVRFNPETNQIDFGGELYYYTRVAAIAEKAGLKKPLLQSYISDGAGERDRWIRGIQLNPHSKPGVAGLGDNNKELDASMWPIKRSLPALSIPSIQKTPFAPNTEQPKPPQRHRSDKSTPAKWCLALI